ncbi:GNAT family N-acetyltransferase [Saccharibacillus kuerlensis]|uniref:Acetyltransferase n=1 Tax=Saccharibacillus kuerlensis TaxID=459527 RepID=A0ABQ2L3F0_9BACL|nr:GNAT family N-acetyltransferase [Saccharibacillus kuerlensis]GGO01232.1 acetyltransferase [Saccharibacillus kuerlensis]
MSKEWAVPIHLRLASEEDAPLIHEMQVRAFTPLMETYQDHETSPASQSIERVLDRILQRETDYYVIKSVGRAVGAIRVVAVDSRNGSYRISPIFVLPEHQGKGIARQAFAWVEQKYYHAERWELEAILEEDRSCRLYEQLGYRQTGERKILNERMTLVFYEKKVSVVE